MKRPKILFVVDVRGWAYDDAALHWQDQLSGEFEIEIIYLSDFSPNKLTPYGIAIFQQLVNGQISSNDPLTRKHPLTSSPSIFDHTRYNGILFFYSRSLRDLRLLGTIVPPEKTAVWINNEKWATEGVNSMYEQYLDHSAHLLFCNNAFILRSFVDVHKNSHRLTQGIDPAVFHVLNKETKKVKKETKGFVVGWSGDYRNAIKNVDLVRSACEKAGVKLLISKNRTREELNNWYNKLDAVICMSTSEGGPLMLLEAGGCRLPVITTHVGLAREIVINYETGLVIRADIDEASIAITKLAQDPDLREKLATNLQHVVLNEWTYEKKKKEVRDALNLLVNN